ncbi:MAG: ATP-binding protein [Bacteroidales bacterium]|nr:ATP-binding protein [Bacteroidales bacterium]
MGDNILIDVSDNGIGMEARHLPRLFERFYRVDKSRSRSIGGSGLGLAIVKHIIESHDQTINVRSTPSVGSTFSFTVKKG